MKVDYTYEIVSADATARCMEIIYASEGRETMHISARLPFVGESLEDVIRMYAPIRYWRDQETAVMTPSAGTKGSLSYSDPVVQPPPTGQQPVVQGAQTL